MSNEDRRLNENAEFSQRPAPPRGWAYRTGPTDEEYRRRAAEMGVTDLVIAARTQPPAAETSADTEEDVTASPISEADPLPRQRRPRIHTAWFRPNSRRYMGPRHRRDQQLTQQWERDQRRSRIAPLLQQMYHLSPIDAVVRFSQQNILNSAKYTGIINEFKTRLQQINQQFQEEVQNVPTTSLDFEKLVNEKYFEVCRARFDAWTHIFRCWKIAFSHWERMVWDHYEVLFPLIGPSGVCEWERSGKFFEFSDPNYEVVHNYILVVVPKRIRDLFKIIENLD